jgi:phage baseplate assembly protein W
MATRGKNIGFSTYDKKSPPFTLEGFELAKQDLYNTFMTKRGERVMRPGYGTVIFDLLFDPFDEDLKDAVVEDATRIISEDPRVELVSLLVNELEHTLRLDIQLLYVPLDVIDTLFIEYDRQNTEAQ